MTELAYREPDPKIIAGAKRRLGDGDRPRGPRPGRVERQAVLRRLDRLRRRAEHQRQPRRRGDARHAAGHQRILRRAGGAHRARAEGADQPASRASTARTTSTRTCRRATRSASSTTRSSARARCWSTWRPASRAASASSASTSSRTPASRSTTSTRTLSFVDLNRTGVALMEIVSRPDIRGPEEAADYVAQAAPDPALSRHLRRQHAGRQPARRRERLACRPARARTELGTRCEIKNMNSMRFITQAIEYEARRQIAILEDGGTVDQETRLYDPEQGRDPLDALQGGGARLPLLPRPRPAAARDRAGLGRRHRGRACPSCPTPRRRASCSTSA